MQDAHEFLVFFCDYVQTHLSSTESSQKVSPMSENFHFILEEERVCFRCKHSTRRPKKDFVFRLDMPEKKSSQADHSIQTLLKKTLLGSGLEVNCPNCANGSQETNVHESKDVFKSLPRVLILYLPRSQFFNDEQVFCKNRVQIDVDVVLDLKDHLAPDLDSSKVSMPEQREESKSRKRNSSFLDGLSSPEVSPKKAPKMSILSNEDMSKMSEEDQLKFAMEQSLNESINSQKKLEDEESRSLMLALEASMKTEESFQDLESFDLSFSDKQSERKVEIKGKTVATEENEYQLTSVISHVNSIASVETGHYIADVYK